MLHSSSANRQTQPMPATATLLGWKLVPPIWLTWYLIFLTLCLVGLRNYYFERYDPSLEIVQSIPKERLNVELVFAGFEHDATGARVWTRKCGGSGKNCGPTQRVVLQTESGVALCTRTITGVELFSRLAQFERDFPVTAVVSPLPQMSRFALAPACGSSQTSTRYVVWSLADPVSGQELLGPDLLVNPTSPRLDAWVLGGAVFFALSLLLGMRRLYAHKPRNTP